MNDTKRSFGKKFSNKHIALKFTKERYDTHTRLSIRFIWIFMYVHPIYLSLPFSTGQIFLPAQPASDDTDNIKANAS